MKLVVVLAWAGCGTVGCVRGNEPARGGEPGAGPLGGHASRYVTSGTWEPDKLASAWLIKRHLRPGSEVELVSVAETTGRDAVPFDVPGVRWSRSPQRSTYETILALEEVEDPALLRIGELVHASEIAYWRLDPSSSEGRFDVELKLCAQEDDVARAYAWLDRLYATLTREASAIGHRASRLLPGSKAKDGIAPGGKADLDRPGGQTRAGEAP